MSDEIKKPDLVSAVEEKQLDEKETLKPAPEASEEELSKAVGGDLQPLQPLQRLQQTLHGPDDTLD